MQLIGKIVSVMLVLILSTACSTLMNKPEPRELWTRLEHTSCTSSKVAPVLDAIGGGILLGWGIVGIGAGNPLSFLDVLAGGLLAFSSSDGSDNAEDCRQLKIHLSTNGGRESTSDTGDDKRQIERQKLEYEKMKLELEREKIELQKFKEQMRK